MKIFNALEQKNFETPPVFNRVERKKYFTLSLIKNTLMCWNSLYFSKVLEDEKDEAKKREIIESIEKDSLMRWTHFNLGGEYDFSSENMRERDYML